MGFTCFLDDAGESSFGGRGDYWVLGGIVLPDDQWPHLRNGMDTVRAKWGVPEGEELKWSDLGVRHGQIKRPLLSSKKKTPIAHLKKHDQVRQLAYDMLDVVATSDGIWILCIYCVKQSAHPLCQSARDPEERCYSWMLSDALERFEYFLDDYRWDPDFGSVVVDEKGRKLDRAVRQLGSELLSKGTQYAKLRHIIDGIRIVDTRTLGRMESKTVHERCSKHVSV